MVVPVKVMTLQSVGLVGWTGRKVARGTHAAAAVLIAAGMLCSVAVLNGAPLAFSDTRAYWVGGKLAVSTASNLIERAVAAGSPEAVAAGGQGGVRGKPLASAVGVRSAFYSVFLYLTERAISFWGTVAVQSAAAAYVLFLFWRCVSPRGLTTTERDISYVAGIALLCLFTSLPWFSSQLMPDIFTGLVILSTALLVLYGRSLSKIEVAILIIFQAYAISTHSTHLAIAAALCLLCLVLAILDRKRAAPPWLVGARLAGPIVLAVGATLAVSLIGFGRLSLAPQSPPFLLARSLADGPARWVLQDTCPASGYVMCRFVGSLPEHEVVYNFIWSPDGIFERASPETRDQIRHEEPAIVARALLTFPAQQLDASIRNLAEQLGEFGLAEFDLGGTVRTDGSEYVLQEGRRGTLAAQLASAVQYSAVVLSVCVLAAAFSFGSNAVPRGRQLILIIVAGVITNALVCGVLSGPTPRYQSRVVWLLPLLGLVFLMSRAARSRSLEWKPFWRREMPMAGARGDDDRWPMNASP